LRNVKVGGASVEEHKVEGSRLGNVKVGGGFIGEGQGWRWVQLGTIKPGGGFG